MALPAVDTSPDRPATRGPDAAVERARVSRYVRRFVYVVIALIVLEVGLAAAAPAMWTATILLVTTLALPLLFIVSRINASRGAVPALEVLAWGLAVLDLVVAVVAPSMMPVLTLVPLWIVAIGLLTRDKRRLDRLVVTAFLLLIVVLITASLSLSRPGVPRWVVLTQMSAFALAAFALAVGLFMDFRAQLFERLDALVTARTALQRTNAELESFTYSASHDLRAPLRRIDTFSGLLATEIGGQLSEAGDLYLRRLQANIKTARALLGALMGLARVTRTPLQPTVCDVSAIATEVLRELAETETDPDRAVVTDVCPGLRVTADATLLRAALTNLLSNAWKFSRAQPTTHIRVSATDAGGGLVWITVADDGIGFDTSDVDEMFAPFTRLNPGGDFEGSGIGLAIVARIAERHGGRVSAESTLGQGAQVSIALPRA